MLRTAAVLFCCYCCFFLTNVVANKDASDSSKTGNITTLTSLNISSGIIIAHEDDIEIDKNDDIMKYEGISSKKLWEQTLEDIRLLAALPSINSPSAKNISSQSSTSSFLNNWKMLQSQWKTTTNTSSYELSPKISFPVTPRPVKPGEAVLPHTDISDKSKKLWIVTTASLPWMTGTAVNPLLRAAYLTQERREAGGSVTILLPWLERLSDRESVYGKKHAFVNETDQELFIRSWLKDVANMGEASVDLNIRWYVAWLQRAENSIYSMGDITALIPNDEVDICVLEEPEHLNWYRAPGESWTNKFKHVVGIVHTNYYFYAQEQPAALIRAPGMRLLSSWMCRAHTHRLIKLSATLDPLAPEKELVENVHGVRRAFLDYGRNLTSRLLSSEDKDIPVFGPDVDDPKIYFIGKMLWSKGVALLMDLLKYAEDSAGLSVKIDMYGGGPNKEEAEIKGNKMNLNMTFHGPLDHVLLADTHKIFINPSTSEVLCTTVAEALAMGKFVIVPSHPSNNFFTQFPNCLPYSNQDEFVGNLYYAMTHAPEPLSEEYSYALTWEAATKRFEAAAAVSVEEAEATAEALNKSGIGIELPLPPLVESETQRTKIISAFRLTRGRYRRFRTRLSQEIQQSNVLPKDLQKKIVAELDKRLDLDLDEILDSQTLRIKLSPAELDKLLLELYNSVVQGPRGDVFRVIGGGTDVGKQFLYLQQQAKQEQQQLRHDKAAVLYNEGGRGEDVASATKSNQTNDNDVSQINLPAERVKLTIRRNLLLPSTFAALNKNAKKVEVPPLFEINIASKKRKKDELEMSIVQGRSNVLHKYHSTFICRSSFTSVFRPKIK